MLGQGGNKGQDSMAGCIAEAAAFDGHLQYCRRMVSASIFKPTWELLRQPHAIELLAQTPIGPVGPMPVLYGDLLGSTEEAEGVIEAQQFKIRRVTCSTLSWEQSLARYMVAAIRKWVGVILTHPPAFDLGRKLNKIEPLGATLHSGLLDVFAGKAAGTLHGRVGPMLRFVAWCNDQGITAFPIHEQSVYDFVRANEDCSAPTFLRSFLVSLSFCHHMLGLLGAHEAVKSLRVVGVTRRAYLRKKKKVQRPPLTVAMVDDLERFVCEQGGSVQDQIAAGFFLLCVFMRGRYSDCLNLQELVVDSPDLAARPLLGYVEGSVSRCKTAYTVERKTQLLPMVAPRQGVSGLDWFSAWLELRKRARVPVGAGVPLLPAPNGEGWQRVPPTAAMAGDWLRNILKSRGHDGSLVSRIGTHSCKTTTLSWMSKAGVDLPTRRLLGYHAQADERTPLVYSRDAMSGPVRALEGVILMIHKSEFLPDASRSGYFPKAVKPPVPAPDDDECSDSEDSADEEDNQEDLDKTDAAEQDVVGEWRHINEAAGGSAGEAPVFRNKLSRTIHRVVDGAEAKFRCGRANSANYSRLGALPKFAYPMCKGCFNV